METLPQPQDEHVDTTDAAYAAELRQEARNDPWVLEAILHREFAAGQIIRAGRIQHAPEAAVQELDHWRQEVVRRKLQMGIED